MCEEDKIQSMLVKDRNNNIIYSEVHIFGTENGACILTICSYVRGYRIKF